MISLDLILNAVKSICKIETDEISGSWLLIKLHVRDNDLFCLMTNERIITKNMIEEE